ncbi:MAG: tryptophan transporter [Clostridium sp.]
MNTKNITLSGVLFAVGLILHQLVPAFGGIKFDFQLSMLFIVILLNNSFKGAIAAGVVSGIITALTTTFPGGQIPNFIDKVITSVIIYALIVMLSNLFNKIKEATENKPGKISIFINNSSNIYVLVGIVALIGTVISGTIFLTSALYIVGLPSGMSVGLGFIVVVIPSTIGNLIITPVLYKLVKRVCRNYVLA